MQCTLKPTNETINTTIELNPPSPRVWVETANCKWIQKKKKKSPTVEQNIYLFENGPHNGNITWWLDDFKHKLLTSSIDGFGDHTFKVHMGLVSLLKIF